MKFNEAWYSLPLEVKQAIAKRVLLNYILIFCIPLIPVIILMIIL